MHLNHLIRVIKTMHLWIHLRKNSPFLDIFISRSKNGFKRYVYQKPTFSRVYFNFISFIYNQYNWSGFYFVILKSFNFFLAVPVLIRKTVIWRTLPIKLVDNCMKTFWIKSFCIPMLNWLLRKKNCFLSYHILVICLLF